ncbi:RNA chaperone ProQ [Glaciecola petra]|uniref:RNA chaperone ProQ n=1 Tax=Glaciecola petra TaxID=3075602 RepID=A0ABU2ZP88_9ALTE|nr:RNA chaperone ProQ [Aestuariibacter sp. P117]MDT0594215.1 RNA chaperone ProQ [Aestuariibacter sp. P117]
MEQDKLVNQKDTLAFLSQTYPQCFFNEGPAKPLKIGIFQDLAKELDGNEAISKRMLRMSLRHYTSSWRYLASIKSGVARIDLQGKECETVEQEHADHAALQLKESKAKAAKLRESRKPNKHKGYQSGKNSDSQATEDSTKVTNTVADERKQMRKKRASIKNSSQKPKNNAAFVKKDKEVREITDEEIALGNSLLVKLGKEPMPVVVTAIGKDGISVQLKSGMTVKVQQHQLYAPTKAR